MTDEALVALGGVAGVVLKGAVDLFIAWWRARSDRDDRTTTRVHRDLEKARDELLVQLHRTGDTIDKLEGDMRREVGALRDELVELRDRLAGLEGLVRGRLDWWEKPRR